MHFIVLKDFEMISNFNGFHHCFQNLLIKKIFMKGSDTIVVIQSLTRDSLNCIKIKACIQEYFFNVGRKCPIIEISDEIMNSISESITKRLFLIYNKIRLLGTTIDPLNCKWIVTFEDKSMFLKDSTGHILFTEFICIQGIIKEFISKYRYLDVKVKYCDDKNFSIEFSI